MRRRYTENQNIHQVRTCCKYENVEQGNGLQITWSIRQISFIKMLADCKLGNLNYAVILNVANNV